MHHNDDDDDDDDYDENENDDRPSVPVAELRGHGDGPIHIVRFTGESGRILSIMITLPDDGIT
jgi:hypothetical protein